MLSLLNEIGKPVRLESLKQVSKKKLQTNTGARDDASDL